ncbi:MAG TPA: CBS domain-containing protein, partial [Rhodanobacteraceae bacterium]|nr:CBS domain-containing protein [Rhodanobacteraceae bacterium]
AYGVSVFLMKRSILTEKIARRGLDIFREYSVDRLEHTSVGSVMTTGVMTVSGDFTVQTLASEYFGTKQQYRAFPVVDGQGCLLDVVDREDVQRWLHEDPTGAARLADVVARDPVVAYPEESCQSVAIRAAVEKLDRIPVVSAEQQKLLGMVTRYDLLKPYTHYHQEEKVRERVFRSGKGSDG